ncbi:MAG: carbohydrate ABC transporter substrate-binding protein [Acidisphaera sp.]|nr:carbohydrate ABC transporter substrate-binding protein [Acidisphaera sp.]
MRGYRWRGLAATLCLVAFGIAGSPRATLAAGDTVTLWWNQGFYPAEDQAFRDVVAAWEKASGNKVDLTFYNGSDLPAKIISAITTGQVPDICYVDNGDFLLLPQNAWNGKIVDVSDVVSTQKAEYNKTALTAASLYDNTRHARSFYGVPLKQQALHYFAWRPMIESAGYKVEDVPTTWDAYFKFFEDVQKKLRAKGQRVYGLGYSLATKDSDSTYLFNQFLVAYGGGGIVTPDGKLHADDPQVRKAAIDALTALTTPYKQGDVPPGAINWGDPDNNNAFYAKQIVMTPNATISIPVAQMEKTDQYMHEILTESGPNGPDGKPVTSLVSIKLAFIPQGAQHVDAAKDFLKFLIQPKNLDKYLAAARGRWLPVMPSIVRDDPYWTDPADPHRKVATHQEVDGPTMPWFQSFNPAYADVNAEQIWGKAEANVMTGGMTPEKAADGALQQITADFAKYPVPAQ